MFVSIRACLLYHNGLFVCGEVNPALTSVVFSERTFDEWSIGFFWSLLLALYAIPSFIMHWLVDPLHSGIVAFHYTKRLLSIGIVTHLTD